MFIILDQFTSVKDILILAGVYKFHYPKFNLKNLGKEIQGRKERKKRGKEKKKKEKEKNEGKKRKGRGKKKKEERKK